MQTHYQLKQEVIQEINKKENLDLRIKLIDYFRCHPTNIAILLKKNDVKFTQYGALRIIAEHLLLTHDQLVEPIN